MQVNTKKGAAARIKLTKRESDALAYACDVLTDIHRMTDNEQLKASSNKAAFAIADVLVAIRGTEKETVGK